MYSSFHRLLVLWEGLRRDCCIFGYLCLYFCHSMQIVSSLEKTSMECQIDLTGKNKKKNIISWLSAKLAQRVVKVQIVPRERVGLSA